MTKFDFGSLDQPFEADWPVTVSVPKNGGGFTKQTFMARFRQVPVSEARALFDAKDANGEPTWTVKTLPKLYFVGLAESEGQQLTDALKDQMIDRANIRTGLQAAYEAFNTGIAAKND